MTNLGGLCLPVESKAPSADEGLLQYIDLSAIDARSKTISEPKHIDANDAPSRARQRVSATDVLVSTVRPNLNGVAQVPAELDGAVASTGFAVLRANPELLDHRYLFHWVRGERFVFEMVRQATGASYPAVSDRIIKASRIPLPPLPEQRRIASILDLASSITAKCDAQKDLFREASSAIFMSMFGDPLLTSRHASAVPLSTVTEAIIDCPHTTPTWTDTGVLCLRTSNLGLGEWNFSEARFVSEETHEVRTRRAVLKAGDLILSREGTIGVGAIVEPEMVASMGQRLVQIRPDTELVLPEFLLAYLLMVLQPSRLTQLLVGSTSRHLNVRDIRALPIDVPSIDRQREFSEAVRAIRVQRRSVDAQTKSAAELLQAVQNRAFRGEL